MRSGNTGAAGDAMRGPHHATGCHGLLRACRSWALYEMLKHPLTDLRTVSIRLWCRG